LKSYPSVSCLFLQQFLLLPWLELALQVYAWMFQWVLCCWIYSYNLEWKDVIILLRVQTLILDNLSQNVHK
jgi:hypothetical protein